MEKYYRRHILRTDGNIFGKRFPKGKSCQTAADFRAELIINSQSNSSTAYSSIPPPPVFLEYDMRTTFSKVARKLGSPIMGDYSHLPYRKD